MSSLVFTDTDHRTPIIKTVQDVAPILEANKAAQLGFERRFARNPLSLRRVASIPLVVMQQLAQRGVVQLTRAGGYRVLDERAFLRFLSDPDHRWLRTDNGQRLA